MHIKVKVYPNSKKERVIEITPKEKYEIYVKEKKERGETNKKMIEKITEFLNLKRKPRIIKGQKSQNKIIEI